MEKRRGEREGREVERGGERKERGRGEREYTHSLSQELSSTQPRLRRSIRYFFDLFLVLYCSFVFILFYFILYFLLSFLFMEVIINMILLVQNRDEQKGSIANWASLEGINKCLRACMRGCVRVACCLRVMRSMCVVLRLRARVSCAS